MNGWETEPEDVLGSAAAASLPTPFDTPYRTPSRGSRRSRRSGTPTEVNSSPPPPLPSERTDKQSKRGSRDVIMDESVSILDPRRFTPTLHASLVSEILTLRRDQEEKLKFIESLEATLHTAREEQESLQDSLLNTAKESRSLKRQLALLEGGTSSALGELVRERDEATEAITDAKRRLEVAQKKVRSQEEDSEKVHDLWAKEKDEWQQERRKYERRLHAADTRLKAILEEVAHFQAAQANSHQSEADGDDGARDYDGASVRTMSLTNSLRYSVIPNKTTGQSLADELNFEDDDEYETDPDGRQSVMSNARHIRTQSRESVLSKTGPRSHRRNMSSDSQMRPGSVARGRFMNQTVLDRLEGGIREDDEYPPAPKREYKDTGVQFSPPPSPKLVPVKPATPEPAAKFEKSPDFESSPRSEWEANQSRKRVHINRPAPIEPPSLAKLMVSTGSQTPTEPISPPRTPSIPLQVVSLPTVEVKPAAHEMVSSSTQTDIPPPLDRPKPAEPLLIPSISVHPPTSRPTTPRNHRLPQYVKDFGCQVSIIDPKPTKSAGIQTDEIRVDTRLDKLPPHLHPSAISSRPVSPNVVITNAEDKSFTPVPGHVPPRNPRRLTTRRSFTSELPSSPPASPGVTDIDTRDAYPGNNDDGPLSGQKAPMRRPHRISSLFAGFDAASSDEADDLADGDGSDSEFRTALSAPQSKPGTHKQRDSNATTSTIDQAPAILRQARNSIKQMGGVADIYGSSGVGRGRDAHTRKPSAGKAMASRVGAMRKSAMIQSGIASHQGRSRSPSLSRNPPFPIPTRASSRQPAFNISNPSEGSQSPTRTGEPWHRRGMRNGIYRTSSIRKSRSAAPVPRSSRNRRQASRSPPPMSPSEETPESPGLPPLPTNDITTPRRDYRAPRYRSHRSVPSTTTANTENTNQESVGSSQPASTVVDAIAQTMVGEWMFKYVRRRKSFGMADTTKGEENSNDRHKRWVWLAPYERAILWSSKQPSSGSALMGKSGRKLTIQSVLDVKDDNAPPKGAGHVFNRSILILTPQRALKFTALNAERHYLWLTALAFLAHSQQAVPDMISPAAPPPVGPTASKLAPSSFGPPPAKSRKPIRDSIMLKKNKGPAAPHGDTVHSNRLEEAFSFKPDDFNAALSHQRELSRDVAEPPFIPRFHEKSSERVHERANQAVVHGRKRSNTGGRAAPPLSFRGFSSPIQSSHHNSTNSTAGNSVITTGSSEVYQPSSNGHSWGPMSTVGSQRTSEASSRPGNNFFEAIGTVRMEAFISPLAFPSFDEYPDEHDELRYRARRRSKDARRRRSRSRRRDSFNSRTTRTTNDYYGGSRTGGEEDYFRDDPFKGF
ncbi:hypothetical protein BKA67DRAFT_516082 [Truncatella angustata]|uniref:Pleckstrin homology domain-containing protein n=1 Tax=Truncatella angustata TaxID=152316 RepID=A0A9P8UNX3_9PEZI|nr:uncharacterized protein BKA67DRAFT_516082 [Truncatella angustata]KAH6655520.1 hypothetical protein BKA67DRAFT_516082 [Truncatella angustata]